jgi:hypothetical protein
MVLTAANLYHYLAGRGFAGPEAVTGEAFRAADLSRRNRAFRVSLPDGAGYVVKQVKKWQRGNVATFESEAHWYWLLRNQPDFAPLVRFGSACLGYDADNQILTLEAPQSCEDMDRYHARVRRFPAALAQLLGETLAAFHGALSPDALERRRGEFGAETPWVLSWHELPDPPADTFSGGALELLHIVRENPAFGAAFDKLRAGWRRQTLINGDMKLAHCVLTEGNSRIYFVDWEMASYGDPLWDAGAILQEYLWAWVRSMPGGSETPVETLVRKARAPLAELQPAIRAFWQSYRQGSGIAAAEAAPLLERCVGYAAAWLIQTAYQSLNNTPRITAQVVRMAQLSANMLASPAEAAHGLLGL